MTWNWSTITLILTAIGYLLPIIMLFIVPTNRKPSSATAWLLLIVLLPYLGLLIYLLIGNPKLPAYRRARQRTATETDHRCVWRRRRAHPEAHPGELALLDPPIPERYQPFVALNTHLGGLPAFAGNQHRTAARLRWIARAHRRGDRESSIFRPYRVLHHRHG